MSKLFLKYYREIGIFFWGVAIGELMMILVNLFI